MRNSSRNTKSVKPDQTNEVTRKFVLASLGAVSLVQKQGLKAIDTLVAEGESFQARTRKAVKTANNDARKAVNGVRKQVVGLVNPIKQRALKNVQQIEASISDGVGSVLGRFGVPSKGDVQELLTRVSELNKEIKASTRKPATSRARA
jgi:poly(hydroxyalkanoate) granule-associated protein